MTNFIRKSASDKGDTSVRRHAKAPSAGSTLGTSSHSGPFGRVLVCALALCALLGASAPSAGAAVPAKGVNGYFGTTGALGGQLATPRGVAVNQTNGNVYVADSNNNRVSVFNSSGTFLRAFGQDVVESGPDNNGTGYEICVAVNGDVCKAGISTASTGGAMQAPQGVAIDSAGNVYVSEQNTMRVQKFDSEGHFLLAFGQDVVESGPDNSPAASASQTLTVTANGGKYKLKFGGKETAELEFNSSAAAIQTALTGLSSIGSGNVTVSETGSQIYKITFGGSLANTPEPLITTESGPGEPLVNGIAGVVNTTTGATGFETCAGGDVCKTGVTGETGGAFKSSFNGYLATAPTGAPNAGNVLVADPSNLRVQEYTPAGAFVRAFGFDIVKAGPDNNGTGFEVCNASAGDACKIGVTGAGSGQFVNSVNRVAEDAEGNIYTVESGANFRVQKFTLPSNVITPQGNFSEANTKGTATTNTPTDVAIDPQTKDVLVVKAFAAGATPNCPGTGVASVAERRVLELTQAGTLEATHMTCAGINAVNGLAMRSSASTGDVYIPSTTTESRLYVLNTPLIAPTATFQGITGVGAHEATVSGFVNPNGPASLPYGLNTSYYFAYKRSADSSFSKVPVTPSEIGRGTTNKLVSRLLPGLEANTSYDVKLIAEKPFGTGFSETALFSFTTPAVAPEISVPTASAADPSGTKAMLFGFITPNSQATTYRFEYGTTESYGTTVPALGGSAGSGAVSVPASQPLTGLQPGTTYHFRLRASNATGAVASPDETFTTPSPTETGLPDDRGVELVSPANKGAAGKVGGFNQNGLPTGNVLGKYQVAEDGGAVSYPILNGIEDSGSGGIIQFKAARESSGWSNSELTPVSTVSGPKYEETEAGHVIYFNPSNLECTVTETFNPLTLDTPAADRENRVTNLYRWTPQSGYTLVTSQVPLNPAATNGVTPIFEVAGANADCSKIFFRSLRYQYAAGISRIYEWDKGTLRDAETFPNGTSQNNEAPGFSLAVRPHSVSSNGRFFFNYLNHANNRKEGVFVRKSSGEVVEASRSTTAVKAEEAFLETATPDGSQVFFHSNYGLTPNSSGGAIANNCASSAALTKISSVRCDIYDYNVETEQLTDITADSNPADAEGAVAQGILAVSHNGSVVYFAARGQLVPGYGNTYAQNLAGSGAASLYRWNKGALSYIGPLAAADLKSGSYDNVLLHDSFGSSLGVELKGGTSQTTANGRYLLYVSAANVTGLNTLGIPEAYLYDASRETLECVSCSGAGAPHTYPAEEVPLLATGYGNALSSTPRSLSEDGRVVFTSYEALAPGAVAGEVNIYEFFRGKVSLLTTGQPLFHGMGGPDDEDVFISSYARLSPEDKDFTADLFDFRVGGGFPAPESPALPCDPAADQCQGAPSAPPAAPSSNSGAEGPGNPPLAKKPKPHGHKKHKHRKHKRRHKRSHRTANSNRGGMK